MFGVLYAGHVAHTHSECPHELASVKAYRLIIHGQLPVEHDFLPIGLVKSKVGVS